MNWKTHAFAALIAVCLLGSLTGCALTPLPPECRSAFPSNGVRTTQFAQASWVQSGSGFAYQVIPAKRCNRG